MCFRQNIGRILSLERLKQFIDVPAIHHAAHSLVAIIISPAAFELTLRNILHMSTIPARKSKNTRDQTHNKKQTEYLPHTTVSMGFAEHHP